ncbi:hypothetical protein FDI24_gp012 [Acidovorax phage ACP17]|uniref:Uncharacterized protein n=1 Tax=Acidovorax phage ACP17 TaxID=2010329 RepID=A0A218M3B7_9CAUD|nr:hypothetical protein FDI24_gp012 [Acidovorax phage ACP17]ASD50546.1 hypothetical protein [Acidovorax phage ACP17]
MKYTPEDLKHIQGFVRVAVKFFGTSGDAFHLVPALEAALLDETDKLRGKAKYQLDEVDGSCTGMCKLTLIYDEAVGQPWWTDTSATHILSAYFRETYGGICDPLASIGASYYEDQLNREVRAEEAKKLLAWVEANVR